MTISLQTIASGGGRVKNWEGGRGGGRCFMNIVRYIRNDIIMATEKKHKKIDKYYKCTIIVRKASVLQNILHLHDVSLLRG